MSNDEQGIRLTRPSACADESRAAQRARLMAMSPRERVLVALRAGMLGKLLARGVRVAEADPLVREDG